MTVWNFSTGPGTHALVVGVGRYPHLLGGGGALFPDHGGMGQLTSAPVSATAFADWLASAYQLPTHPLCSIDLLVSGGAPLTYQPPAAGAAAQAVERASFDNFKAAVLRWYAALSTSPDNRAVFYFCGHGLAAGLQTTLLLDDFGDVPHAAFAHALDFDRFYLGMDPCAARTQCYFIDACRVASRTLFEIDTFGESILTPSRKHSTPARRAPVFYSTMLGTQAFGRTEQPSLYMSALLKAMTGPGAVRKGNAWEIRPSTLSLAMEELLNREAEAAGATQNCNANNVVDFPLHRLSGPPDIPVTVSCETQVDLANAILRVVGGASPREHEPSSPPWNLVLPYGTYEFIAVPEGAAPDAPRHVQTESVFPPLTEVVLPCP
ncbi:caspase family protein [Myxococcus stipitatus]|uniref:caspase family protein n=1 Tax=Myxococcus stipitatus TaxID=83455 RepID=UPI001F47C168|nr:caspase family protein [Myxococcus stipitatus]MCE9670495.1 caspase family protein [Myxococcus stipitatus]